MRELLTQQPAVNMQPGCAVARIMLLDRDAALAGSMHNAAQRAKPGQAVVGVVGEAHLMGICNCWPRAVEAQARPAPSTPP